MRRLAFLQTEWPIGIPAIAAGLVLLLSFTGLILHHSTPILQPSSAHLLSPLPYNSSWVFLLTALTMIAAYYQHEEYRCMAVALTGSALLAAMGGLISLLHLSHLNILPGSSLLMPFLISDIAPIGIAPASALCFMLMGSAILCHVLLLHWPYRTFFNRTCCALTLLLALLGITAHFAGFASRPPSLFIGYIPPGSALCFLLLAGGWMLHMKIYAHNGKYGTLIGRLLLINSLILATTAAIALQLRVQPVAPSTLLWVVSISGLLLSIMASTIYGYAAAARRRERTLQVVTQRLEHILDNAGEGIWWLDMLGQITFANKAASDITGYSERTMMSHPYTGFLRPDPDLPEDQQQKARETINQCMQDGMPRTESRELLQRKDGSFCPIEYRCTPIQAEHGAITSAVMIFRDITQRKEMERMKNEFVSTVSHELRTPLTSIVGSLGLLSGGVLGSLPEKAQHMANIAHKNSERLMVIINDILDIEKAGSGKMEMSLESLHIKAFLEQSMESNQGYGDTYHVRFVLQDAPDKIQVTADPARLMQVMANLLSNAAKFTSAESPDKRAEVHIRAREEGEMVRVEVQDYGIGIAEEFRPRIFEKFAQQDGATTRKFQGTGLGLSITRTLIEAMGGVIGFDTEIGKGTTFYFTLPKTATLAPHRSTKMPHEKDAMDPELQAAIEASMAPLRTRYLEQMEERLAVLKTTEQALQDGEWDAELRDALIQHAHKLAGNGATYGFNAISDAGRTLEDYLERTPDATHDTMLPLLQQLIHACEAARATNP